MKAFLPFLQGVPARYTELHRAYPGWLVGKAQVFICPSHDHPQIHFDSIWSCEGQINTCDFPTSHPGYALCSSVYQAGTPCKNGRKAFTCITLPAILPKDIRHQLVCWQASTRVSWAVGGVCKVFACLLGS